MEREHNPVRAGGIGFGAAIASSDREGVEVAADDGVIGLAGQGFRMQAGVGKHGGVLGQPANGEGSKFVGLGHGASSAIGVLLVEALQLGVAELLTFLLHGAGNVVFYFCRGKVGEGMAEVLNNIELVSAANHAQPDHVVGRVEQVRAMGRRKHEVFVPVLGVIVKRNIFSLLIEQEARRRTKALRQRRLALKLMRELMRVEHALGVLVGGAGKSGIESQRRNSCLTARLVGQGQKLLLGLKLIINKRNVGSGRGHGMNLAFLRLAGGCRAGRWGCHQSRHRLKACGAYAEQERQKQS